VDTEILKSVELFQQLPDDTLARVGGLLERRAYDAGQILFHKGDPGEEMFIVETGAVSIFEPGTDSAADTAPSAPPAGEEGVLRIFGPGEALGEMALIDFQPRTLSARAKEPTEALVLHGHDFRRLLQDHDVALAVMSSLNERIRYTTDFLGEVRQWVGRMANGQYRETTHFFDEMQSWVRHVAAGEYDEAVTGAGAQGVQYRDQTMAVLAAEFARMATQVRRREDELRQEIDQLKIEIDHTRRKHQVAEITETDFFQDIKARADQLRRRQK
jgi:CRP-like cAMP-binding protein